MKKAREEVIDILINLQFSLFNNGELWLDDIFRYGWDGYEARSNEELIEEYNETVGKEKGEWIAEIT